MRRNIKSDEYVRRAIYEVYGKKCFFTEEPLNYRDMQLDHIIPQKLKENKERLNGLFKRCGVSEDFDLDSLYNLIPTSRLENRRKSDNEYSDNTIMHYLEQISRMVPKVEKQIAKLKKNVNFEKDISNIKAHLDVESNDKDREKIIEKLVSFISNEDEDFIECEEIYDFEERKIYRKYTKRIGIEAVLPKYNNCEIECILYFKTLKIRDCKIVLNNETILKELFNGVSTDPKYGIRGFIKHDKGINEDLTHEELEGFEIKLGNNRLMLNYDDIYLLCEVADSFAIKYFSEINEIENILKTSRFPLSKRRNSYKLLSVNPDQWFELYKFANKHDVDNGNSQWHIFDRRPTYSQINIYTCKEHPKYEVGYHSFFTIEKDEDCVFYPSIASKKFVITWQFIEDIDKESLKFLNSRENWDAEYAYNWFVNEFIPQVGIRLNKKSIFGKKISMLDDFFENNKISLIEYIDSNEVKTEIDIRNVIEKLQKHFYTRAKYKYRLSKVDFEGVYSLLIYIIKISKKIDKHYLCDKLGLGICSSSEHILIKLGEFIKNSIEKTV